MKCPKMYEGGVCMAINKRQSFDSCPILYTILDSAIDKLSHLLHTQIETIFFFFAHYSVLFKIFATFHFDDK